MRSELISGFLQHLDADGELGVGVDTAKTEAAVEALPLPIGLKRIIQWSWPQKYGQFGPLEIFDVESILEEECLDVFLKHSLLPVGKAGNGDWLVIYFAEADRCPVGFVRLFDPQERMPDLSKDYFQLEASLERFLFRAAEGLYLPGDSYECAAWDSFTRELEPRKPA